MDDFWMTVLYLVGIYLGFCGGVGAIWQGKGRSFFGGFILSIFISPIIGLIIGLAMSSNKEKLAERGLSVGTMKKCPYCAETVKREAVVCRYCGKELEDEFKGKKSLVKISASGKFFLCPFCNAGLKSADVTECWKCHAKLVKE